MANEKILIVEDERIVAEDIKIRLTSMGYQVVGISVTGENAIAQAREKHPDFILMDIKLKGEMDGIEAARTISDELAIPFSFMTANADEATVQKAKLVRPMGYMLKPIDNNAQLRTTIEVGLYRCAREKKLKESEQWLNTTLKSMDNGVLATDATCTVVYMNPAACLLSGISSEHAIGMKLASVLVLKDVHTDQKIEGLFERVLIDDTYRASKGTATLKSRDGYELPIDFVASPIKADDGRKTGVLVVFNDITDKLKIEEALHLGERKHHGVTTACGEGVASVDESYNVTYANGNLASFLGYSERYILGHSILNYLTPESAARLQKRLSVESGSTPDRCEFELVKKDGGTVWAIFTITRMTDSKGTYTGALIMVSDITEQKAKEAELKRALTLANQNLDIIEYKISALHRELLAHLKYAGDVLKEQSGLETRHRLVLDRPVEVLEAAMVLLEELRKQRYSETESPDLCGQPALACQSELH